VVYAVFREHGLLTMTRTDNGPPFASYAIGRISRLSVWWLKLGIYPELIEPEHHEQNGRHGRVHRTLKAETTRPPAANRRSQQRRCSSFQRTYNEKRTHEALGQNTPASVYRPPNRMFPDRRRPFEYPSHFQVRRVSNDAGIRRHFHRVNISHVLGDECVGLDESTTTSGTSTSAPSDWATSMRNSSRSKTLRDAEEDEEHQECYPCTQNEVSTMSPAVRALQARGSAVPCSLSLRMSTANL
jgi:hypothetical protein